MLPPVNAKEPQETGDRLSEEARKLLARKATFLRHLGEEFFRKSHTHQVLHFPRGDIITQPDKPSEWIYIILKGRVSIVKQLTSTKAESAKINNDSPGLELPPLTHFRRQLTIYRNIYHVEKRLEQTLPGYLNASDRLGSLPYDLIIQQHKQRVYRPVQDESRQLPQITIDDVTFHSTSFTSRPMSLVQKNSKGVYLSMTRRPTENRKKGKQGTTENVMCKGTREGIKNRNGHTGKRNKRKISRGDKATSTNSYTYVLLSVLEEGQYFGLSEALFKHRSCYTAVSNGTECVRISTKFFLHYTDDDCLNDLRMAEHPDPTTSVLKQKLATHLKWKDYKSKVYDRLVKSINDRHQLLSQFHQQHQGEYCFRTGPR